MTIPKLSFPITKFSRENSHPKKMRPARPPNSNLQNKLYRCNPMRAATSILILIIGLLLATSFWREINYSLVYQPFLSLQDDDDATQYLVNQDSVGEQVFRSPKEFMMDYAEMGREFKVFVYPEDGNTKTSFRWPTNLNTKYTSECYFLHNLRMSRFFTEDPKEAHLFFIPTCSPNLRYQEAEPGNVEMIVRNYIETLITKYPYFRRSLGADHFFVICNDISIKVAEWIPFLIKNTVSLTCSPSYNSSHIPRKDVSFPQMLELSLIPLVGDVRGNWSSDGRSLTSKLLLPLEKQPPRTRLGFWVGSENSDIRKLLVSVWGNDTELAIKTNDASRAVLLSRYRMVYYRTKFCICPRGTQFDGICLMESITFGCVPVILSDYYDLPFYDILDWKKFSMIVKENDVHKLKEILKGVPEAEFEKKNQNVIKVQKHFQWNLDPLEYDAFHLVMYQLWQRRHIVRAVDF